MKPLILLIALSGLLTNSATAQEPFLELTARLKTFDIIPDDIMYAGEGGTGEQYVPEVVLVYQEWLELGTEADFRRTFNDANSVVACYSYRALLEKGVTDIIPLLTEARYKSTTVDSVSDDIIWTQSCYRWMLERTAFHLKYMYLELDEKTMKAFEKMVADEKLK